MALTKKDIEKLSGAFATKADLENFPTKSELEKFKSEIKDQVLTSEDRIMKKLEDISTEQKMSRLQGRRQEDKLENHETRISVLEKA